MQPISVFGLLQRPCSRRGGGRRIAVSVCAALAVVTAPFACANEPAKRTNDRASIVDGAIALTTNQNGNSVSVVRIGAKGAMHVETTIEVTGKPAGIALSRDRLTAYVTAPEARELVVIDMRKRAVVKRVKVGEGPLGIAVNPVTGDVLVADWYEHKLRVIDPATLATKAEILTGQSPSGVAVTR